MSPTQKVEQNKKYLVQMCVSRGLSRKHMHDQNHIINYQLTIACIATLRMLWQLSNTFTFVCVDLMIGDPLRMINPRANKKSIS